MRMGVWRREALKKIEVKYRNSWILAIILFFLSILVPIIAFITTYEFKLKTSVFLAFPLVHLWWFVPPEAGYLPFFYRNLIYHPNLMKKVFWFMFLWPLLIIILTLIDYASNLWLTSALFASVSFASGALSSIIGLVATVLPFLAKKLDGFLSKVDIEVLGFARERAMIIGYGERFYNSPEVLQKGLPIMVRNGGRRAIAVSHVILGATSLNIPLNFKTRSGETAIEYAIEWTLPEWIIVKSKSSQILYIPWQKVIKASVRAEEITRNVGKRPRFYIGIYDPFPNEQFWSEKINHQALMAEFSSLEWMKSHPEWGKE